MSYATLSSVTVGPLAAASANNIVTTITPTSGTTLTLNGATVTAGVAILDKPRRVLLTYGSEGSARTLIITGTNNDGNPIQETLAVPSGGSGTVATTQDFKTVISAKPLGDGWTAAIVLGTNTVAGTQPVFANPYFGPPNLEIECVASGTVSFTCEYTNQDLCNNSNQIGSQALGNYPTPVTWYPHPTLVTKTGTADGVITWPITAWRITLLSGTGSVTATGLMAGIFNG